MIKNTLWFTLGMLLTAVPLIVIKHQTGQPPPFPASIYVVAAIGFVMLLVVIRIMDRLFKGLFARQPAAERFATGFIMGCYIFVLGFLHR